MKKLLLALALTLPFAAAAQTEDELRAQLRTAQATYCDQLVEVVDLFGQGRYAGVSRSSFEFMARANSDDARILEIVYEAPDLPPPHDQQFIRDLGVVIRAECREKHGLDD